MRMNKLPSAYSRRELYLSLCHRRLRGEPRPVMWTNVSGTDRFGPIESSCEFAQREKPQRAVPAHPRHSRQNKRWCSNLAGVLTVERTVPKMESVKPMECFVRRLQPESEHGTACFPAPNAPGCRSRAPGANGARKQGHGLPLITRCCALPHVLSSSKGTAFSWRDETRLKQCNALLGAPGLAHISLRSFYPVAFDRARAAASSTRCGLRRFTASSFVGAS